NYPWWYRTSRRCSCRGIAGNFGVPGSGDGHQKAHCGAIASANPHTIVVLETGGPQVMPWLNQVGAVLEAWYPGQKGGEAIANILFGDVNPSGKLPLTFPKSVNDLPRPQIPFFPQANPGSFDVNYSEGFLVGYKWYDAHQLEPLFPFGYGLSYSTFSFSNLHIFNEESGVGGKSIQVSCDVTNTSNRAGAEVAQIYVGLPTSTGEPPRRLVGWSKVWLQPWETQHVTIDIDPARSSHPFSYWNTNNNAWEMATGKYTIYVGDSSRHTQLSNELFLGGRDN
ncbi:MAG: glycoside hydrolase family 3 C-terminal domain-containing protein, partial [Terracidiphilus sp.]